MRWKIFYGDGSTFDNTQGDPADSPVFDVQCIVQLDFLPKISPHYVGRLNITGGDWFWWNGEYWQTGDLFGLLDAAIHGKCVIARQGRMLPAHIYNEIYKQAVTDSDFQQQSAQRIRDEQPTRRRTN